MSIGLAKESIDCCAAFMGLNVLGSLGGFSDIKKVCHAVNGLCLSRNDIVSCLVILELLGILCVIYC